MRVKNPGIAVTLLIALLFLVPFSTASESVIPYVRIDTPQN